MNQWNGNRQSRIFACNSYNRSVSEIDEERRRSGWNPYQGEEEDSADMEHAEDTRYMEDPAAGELLFPEDEMAAAKAVERDLRMLQSMYPQAAKLLLPYVQEACDKMEYEGSLMYDEYPDQTMVRRIQEAIYEETADQFPPQPQPEPDDMLMMQIPGNRQNPPGQNWVRDLIQVLLLQEMHHRRCRYRNCRRDRRPPRRPVPPRRPQPPRRPSTGRY